MDVQKTRESGHHGGGGICIRRFHRAVRRRSDQASLRRIFSGRTDLAARKIRHPEIPAAVRQKGRRFFHFVSEIIASCRTVRKKVPFLSIQKKRIMLI